MLQLLPNPKIDFMSKRRLWVGISLSLVAVSLVILFTKGVKRGIEFQGGAEIQLKYKTAPDVGAVRAAVEKSGFPGSIVTTIGKAEEHEIYIRVPLTEGASDQDLASRAIAALKSAQGADAFEVRSQNYIGPTIGRELVKKALGAILGSMAGMLIYIWIRFQFQWGLAAVIALFHDALITLGLFALFDYEMSLPVVAAFLTLIGYSVNDTVVIFDRIRENVRARGGTITNMPELINQSLNQTLSRTILTSLLTWIVCVALFLMGGPALRDFSFVLVFGIIVGSYSTIYIAAPVLVVWQDWLGKRSKEKAQAAAPKAVAKKVRTGKA